MARGPAYARRKDGNHAEVRDEYRRLGCYVKDIDFVADLFVVVPCCELCRGCFEWSIGWRCDMCPRMWVEIKKDEKEPLTENEKIWQLLIGDQHVIVRSLEDVRKSIERTP